MSTLRIEQLSRGKQQTPFSPYESSNSKNEDLNFLSEDRRDGLELIWFYWYLKFVKNSAIEIGKHSEKSVEFTSLRAVRELLAPYKQFYQIETIDQQKEYSSLSAIKERACITQNDRFFVIDPEEQFSQIKSCLRDASPRNERNFQRAGSESQISKSVEQQSGRLQNVLEDMILELETYYLNCKSIFVIYKPAEASVNENRSISSRDSAENHLRMILTRNSSESRLCTSKDSKGSQGNAVERKSFGSLKSSLMVTKLGEDDSVMIGGGLESLDSFTEKIENKIEDMEILDRLDEFEGMELWNCKYKNIPHTFLKIKKQSWAKCLNLQLLHPSAPKTINEFPIVPRLTKLSPSADKLPYFVSLMAQIESKFPNLLPSVDSIYEYNGMPYVFLEEDNGYASWKWETNISVLCYFIVFGAEDKEITPKRVERWLRENENTQSTIKIRELARKFKERQNKRKQMLSRIIRQGEAEAGEVSEGNQEEKQSQNAKRQAHFTRAQQNEVKGREHQGQGESLWTGDLSIW